MTQVVYIADRFIQPNDANSIVLFADASGQFLIRSSISPALPEGDRVDLPTAIMAAVELADRDGIPTVYVVNG
jgi:hypothetical protein